ncbi:MAG: peptidylprolyl isomerase [Planctomycetes bacterium]|nr:peptidylprolyl isomerase [Planctomycetota bacterium]
MLVLRAGSEEEAKKLAGDDPAVKSGLLTATVHPWRAVFPKRSILENPRDPKVNLTAPDEFRAKFETSRGDFVVKVTRDRAPRGADRFYSLVKNGYYDGCRFFRVLSGFVAQFGIHGDPKISAAWRAAAIKDDPVKSSNKRGTICYATGGADTRTTQIFINFGDNSRLDGMGFAAFGEVVEGMEVVEALYSGYGEGAPRGRGPDQGRIQTEGNEYLEREFPKLDHVKTARVVE